MHSENYILHFENFYSIFWQFLLLFKNLSCFFEIFILHFGKFAYFEKFALQKRQGQRRSFLSSLSLPFFFLNYSFIYS